MKVTLKAKCRITGKYFEVTVNNDEGEAVVTYFSLATDEYASTIIPTHKVRPHLPFVKDIKGCPNCGNHLFACCECLKKSRNCLKEEDYDADCKYCNELVFEYPESVKKNEGYHLSYSKWAGAEHIEADKYDKFGNPDGEEFDLIKDGDMKGYRIVIMTFPGFPNQSIVNALEKKGFEVILYYFHYDNGNRPSLDIFKKEINKPKTQLWILSNDRLTQKEIYDEIISAYRNGTNLYLWSDNAPLFVETNYLLRMLFDDCPRFYGNDPGEKVLGVSKAYGSPGITSNHPIATGILKFYEGVSISRLVPGKHIHPIVFSSSHKVLTGYYEDNTSRLLVDGGFTRLGYYNTSSDSAAGTERFIVNCATWLAYIEKNEDEVDLPTLE